MKKYFLLLIALLVILSLATITQAQTTLKLNVILDDIDPHKVTYVATLSPVVNGATIDFFTEFVHDVMPPFPTKYVGSARIDINGVAKLTFRQESGPWEGGAIWKDGANIFRSNIVDYTIPY